MKHVATTDSAAMAALERRLEPLREDLANVGDGFAELIDSPVERALWTRVRWELATVDTELDTTLALSRVNRNFGAAARMADLEEKAYASLDRDISELVAVNRRQADAALARREAIERHARTVATAAQIAGLVGLLLVGAWGFRRVAEEQRQVSLVRSLELRNRELDAFAGRVAHDLRNPIGVIALATDALDKGERVDPRTTARLHRGVQRVQQLVDDLLALSRAAGELGDATCDAAAVAAKIRDDFAERFGGDADLRVDVESARVRYREGLLAQAVWNLVENGVKYRRADVRAEVRVTGRTVGDRYELVVADNGRGMSADDAARVFEPFYRGASAADQTGTGLGLSIVERVIEARGGRATVSSQLGRGSAFVLRLPLVSAMRTDS
jgi:signal transduction histidine kinase